VNIDLIWIVNINTVF